MRGNLRCICVISINYSLFLAFRIDIWPMIEFILFSCTSHSTSHIDRFVAWQIGVARHLVSRGIWNCSARFTNDPLIKCIIPNYFLNINSIGCCMCGAWCVHSCHNQIMFTNNTYNFSNRLCSFPRLSALTLCTWPADMSHVNSGSNNRATAVYSLATKFCHSSSSQIVETNKH